MMLSRTDNRAARRRGGFTLVEMLIAMALVIIFGAMAVGTLKLGTDLWRSGHRRTAAYDAATVIFSQVEDDIAAAKNQFWTNDADAFDTRIKFWVDYDRFFEVNYGNTDPYLGHQRLRFVRGIPDDALNPRIRQAGDGVDNDGDGSTDQEYYNLIDDDGDNLLDEDLMPLEGMCEVAYMRGLNTDDGHTLYRAVLAPIGLTPTVNDDQGRSGLDHAGRTFFEDQIFDDVDRIGWKAQPLADNVLHFEVRCWSQYTTTWDDGFDFKVWPSSYEPIRCGPVFNWDSDRLSSAASIWSPDFVMDWGPGFPISGDHDGDGTPNSQDEDYVAGNVFPRAIMVVVCVTPPDNLRPMAPMTLAAPISDADPTIYVNGSLPNYNPRWPYLRIGDEWIRFQSFDTDTQAFDVTGGRGARETDNEPHSTIGDRVRFGYTFSRVFFNPTSRDYWGD